MFGFNTNQFKRTHKMRFLPGLISVFLLHSLLLLNAQIFAPQADYSLKISYNTYSGNDSVFVFYNPDNGTRKGSLTAFPPLSGNYSFQWSMYDHVNKSFAPPFLVHSNTRQSVAPNLENGGYQVRITNGIDTDTVFIAWVFLNQLKVNIEKDIHGKIKPHKYTCDFLILDGVVIPDTFYYYDQISHDPVWLKNGYTFLWESDPDDPEYPIPNRNKILESNITYNPPPKDTRFILTAIDSFGMKISDEVLYESIHVKSDFIIQALDMKETQLFNNVNLPFEDGSPLTIKFINKSLNGYEFEWIFADSARSGMFSNEYTTDVNYYPEFTYYIPADYYPVLIAKSLEGCVDTLRTEDRITVLPSLLDVPNVFTPDGDDLNSHFKVGHRSLKAFSIVIMNRWGKVVYKADVKDMYSWEGWNGNILNTNNPAAPGPYFYVIEALGWDNEKYIRGQYKGTVYLFRGD